jgi:hypothetical protein
MKKLYTLLLLVSPYFTWAQNTWPEALIITPEKSNFVKTSTHKEVLDFLDAIQKLSKEVKVISMVSWWYIYRGIYMPVKWKAKKH